MAEVKLERGGARTTVHLLGDLANEPWLVQVLRLVLEDLEDERVREIHLDLSKATGFDMQCLAEVVGLSREVRNAHRTFRVSKVSPTVRRVLQHAEIADAL